MKLGEASTLAAIDVIPSGSLSLDLAMGVGAYLGGGSQRSMPESSTDHSGSACHRTGQKLGGNVAYVDVEHALDPHTRRDAASR